MISRLPRALLWTLSCGAALLFVWLVANRVGYPLELDCIEGVMMDHVVRLAQGKSIFVQPSLDFIPLAYMPFFAFVSSILARVFGPHFWEPRLVSLLAVFGTAALTLKIVRHETRSWTLAVAGAAIYFMAFGFTGSCYDVARPDSLMVMLAFAGLAVLRFSTGTRGAIGAALLLTLAFFTKQHATWFALAGLLHLAFNDRRRVVPFGVAMLIGGAGGYALMVAWLGPWFPFFTLEVPSHWSELHRMRVLRYVGHGLIGTLGMLVGPPVVSLVLGRKLWRGPEGLWAWAGLGAIGTGLLATLDPSAYLHMYIPTVVAFCVLGPIALHRIASAAADSGLIPSPRAANAACLALSLQFVPLVYTVHDQLPHPRAVEAHRALIEDIRNQPGRVLTPYHGFYTWTAGKGTSLHIIPLDDIVRAHGNRLLTHDPAYLERMFEGLRRGEERPVIISDVPLSKSGPLWAPLEDSYVLAGDLGWISTPLRPVSGNRFAPTYVFVPRPSTMREMPAGTRPPGPPSAAHGRDAKSAAGAKTTAATPRVLSSRVP